MLNAVTGYVISFSGLGITSIPSRMYKGTIPTFLSICTLLTPFPTGKEQLQINYVTIYLINEYALCQKMYIGQLANHCLSWKVRFIVCA